MNFDVFEQEAAVVERAKTLLDSGSVVGDDAIKHFAQLAKAYEKLLKSSRRLVRLSDRNEEKLNEFARSLDEKNKLLEELSLKLSKYLSPQIYNSIFSGSQDATLQTSRKKLTVIFSDIVGFTDTADRMQPEDLTLLINQYLSEMSVIALTYGATIDKFVGDAILMFFGDPESKGVREDAASCVRMAMAMKERLEDLNEVWRDSGVERPFRMRIGINTGYCNVGNFGSDQRMDYTILGGEVNLAARLESRAKPGQVLISFETYSLVSDIIEAEELPSVQVKGIGRPIRPFSVRSVLEDGVATERLLRRKRDGLLLYLDRDRLGEDGRQQAENELEAALQQLRNWRR
ncbi:MAG: adenylate/guanylate cyclase domain-containing protein [Hyphomicrobiales bacterium]|nr:adenylate/guanylate cyclase domain-containing protein [Hyphomicrobiales bacterium]